jgi:GR25 family glycosyltransferase involved in LPS biosynthesis
MKSVNYKLNTRYAAKIITLDATVDQGILGAIRESLPINLELYKGHFGPDTYDEWAKGRSAEGRLGPGAYGAFMSHLELWQELVASDLDGMIIFEDDAVPVADPESTKLFLERLLEAPQFEYLNMGRISPPFFRTVGQVIGYLGSSWGAEFIELTRLKILEKAWVAHFLSPRPVKKQHLNMHAYYLSRKLATILCNEVTSPITFVPIDEFVLSLTRVPEFKIYEMEPPLYTINYRPSVTGEIGR